MIQILKWLHLSNILGEIISSVKESNKSWYEVGVEASVVSLISNSVGYIGLMRLCNNSFICIERTYSFYYKWKIKGRTSCLLFARTNSAS